MLVLMHTIILCKYTALVNPQRACAGGGTLYVCVSVNQQLTSGESVHFENNITYSTGNDGQKIFVDFSVTTLLQKYTTSCIGSPCSWKLRMRIISVSIVRVFSRIHARVAPRVLHFSALIVFTLSDYSQS